MQQTPLFSRLDLLNELNEKSNISEQISLIHKTTKDCFSFIDRIAIAVYDPECDILKTFAHSTDAGNPLPNYQAKLSEATSLKQISTDRKSRVANDLATFDQSTHTHAKQIRKHGFLSSYTAPMFQDGRLLGFIFFNSRHRYAFTEEHFAFLDVICRLITQLISNELKNIATLRGALKTATEFSHHRDPETGAHLERMARYSRLMASELAPKYGFNDEFIEQIYWFAPMHDVGKIAIPDHILLKPGKLDADEFEIMKTHTTMGQHIISDMLHNFHLNSSHAASMCANITAFHHEKIDGSGYPEGLRGEEIPIEARIVAIADIFDALTSERPYKKAWSNEAAFAELRREAGVTLDADFVDAFIASQEKIESIQQQFQNDSTR